jgi:hypothetical protein
MTKFILTGSGISILKKLSLVFQQVRRFSKLKTRI